MRVTIEPRCVITSYTPSVIIGVDQRYRIAVDGLMYLPFDFVFEPANCNYYQIYSLLVNNAEMPEWVTIDTLNKRLIIDTANGAYEGIYSMVLSSQINHIPVVSTEQTIDFVMTLTATECVKTTFIDQTISDMNFIINHNQPDTVQTMLDW